MLAVLFVPQLLFCWFSGAILLALRQDPEVARLAGLYLRTFAFALPGYATLEVTRRWLQGQGLLLVPTFCLILGAPLNIALNVLLVWGPDWARIGFVGAPLASAISFTVMGAASLLYCVFFAPRVCWGGWPTAAGFFDARGFGDNVRFGVSGILCVSHSRFVYTLTCEQLGRQRVVLVAPLSAHLADVSTGAWELVSLFTAYIGAQALAAQSVLLCALIESSRSGSPLHSYSLPDLPAALCHRLGGGRADR